MNTITPKLSYNANPIRTASFKAHPDFNKLIETDTEELYKGIFRKKG